MPPRPPERHPLPTNIFTRPMTKRDIVSLPRRQHSRRRIPLPGLSDLPHIPDLPAFNLDIDPGEDTDDGGINTDDGGPALASAVPHHSTQPAAAPLLSIVPSVQVLSFVPVAQTAAPLPSTTVNAVPESIPTNIATFRPLPFPTSASEAEPTTSTTKGFAHDDDNDALPTGPTINPTPTVFYLSASTVASSTTSNGQPSLSSNNSVLPAKVDPTRESKAAVAAAVSIICIALFFGIIYCLFRFCQPVRNRWLAFKTRKQHKRQKQTGMDDATLPPPVVVADGAAMQQHSTCATDGTLMRNIGIENGVMRELESPHLRPPSYRSHWTASGASWVANGLRIPERVNEQMMRWSDRGARSRMMGPRQQVGGDTENKSSHAGIGLVGDALRPLGMNPYGTGEIFQTSRSTAQARVSALSGSTTASQRSSQPSDGRTGTRESSQAGFSTNARISDMSSLSAGTTTNTFRPPPLFRAPVGVARGSGTGLIP